MSLFCFGASCWWPARGGARPTEVPSLLRSTRAARLLSSFGYWYACGREARSRQVCVGFHTAGGIWLRGGSWRGQSSQQNLIILYGKKCL